jgi:hypothetical protein
VARAAQIDTLRARVERFQRTLTRPVPRREGDPCGRLKGTKGIHAARWYS